MQQQFKDVLIGEELDGWSVEFEGAPDFQLMVQSLEDIRAGIRLRNVRTEKRGDSDCTLATVFIPKSKRAHFLRKIDSYLTEQNRRSNRPKNAALIESISDVRRAVLESFWGQEDRPFMPGDELTWLEVWLASDQQPIVTAFETILQRLDIQSSFETLTFPERTVRLIRANRAQLERLIAASDEIAEFRPAKGVATFFIEQNNADQTRNVQELLARCTFDPASKVSVCILDGGINNGHQLIQPILADRDLHSVMPQWGTADDTGHGTRMAGTVAYGDLLGLVQDGSPRRISHRLESAKILPPPPERNPQRLWGSYTAQGISHAEIERPDIKRIVCMAIAATDTRDRGRPSSWSAAIDALASGYADHTRRLIVVSAGNTDQTSDWHNYPLSNETNEVHDPGQAWNAVTVGAFTEKTRITDPTLRDYTPIAPSGGISPYTTTSGNWDPGLWPIKPEILLEGGNIAIGPNQSVFDSEDLQLLTTGHRPQETQFTGFSGTSAASAQAAWMAAQIQTQYPDAWPETIRALLVHSANWTQAMKQQFLNDESKKEYSKLARRCGYGVPSLERALFSLRNSLTLIAQGSLQPYERRDAQYVTKDMQFYRLPWPRDVLQGLGETQVSMRATLSYFIEPGPGEVGWRDRYRYASFGLRFDMNGPSESEIDFLQRINRQAREDDQNTWTGGQGLNWAIGGARNVGSIHSDIWQGNAAALSTSNMIAVYPVVGWWRERTNLSKWTQSCRYALVVSIQTPEQAADIYTPVATQLRVAVPIPIAVEARRPA